MSAPGTGHGRYLTDHTGDRRWYAYPQETRCRGTGSLRCRCGGDSCVCANGGDIECEGCEDCEPTNYWDYEEDA